MTEENKEPVEWYYKLVACMTIIGGAWVIWKPLGAVMTIMALGCFRKRVRSNAFYWDEPKLPITFGSIAGVTIAGTTMLTAKLSVNNLWATVAFGAIGFIVVNYIGYGTSNSMPINHISNYEANIKYAQVSAVITYLILTILIFIYRYII